MFKDLSLRVQNLILVTMIPAILLVVILMAAVLYSDLYNTILKGFDKKLFALGSSVASFIDGGEHRSVSEMSQFRGIAYRQGKLYANTFAGVHLIEIDPKSGNIRQLPNDIGFEAVGGLAYVPKKDKLYGAVFESKELVEIDPVTGKGSLVGVLEHDVAGVAYSESFGMVGTTYEELVSIDYERGTSTVIGDLEVLKAQGLTFHQNKLIAIETEKSVVYEINPENASSKKITNVRHPSGEPILFGSFDMTSDGTDLFLVTTVPIFRMSSGYVVDKLNISDLSWQKLGDMYSKYVLPMIRIKDERDATFLYTAILKNQVEQIYYNIDSTQSPIHSFIGYTDPSPADDRVKDVWLKGKPYLSEIVFWEEWGLLKSSYVPIKTTEGEITGYAGADVNIDIINSKTKQMLFRIVIVGLVSIFLGTLVSLTMAKALTRPIETLKQAALEIASGAGNFGLRVPESNINEIQDLSKSFNFLSSSLEDKITSISEEIHQKNKTSTMREVTNWLSAGEPSNLLIKWSSGENQIDITDKMIGASKILFFWQITGGVFSNIERANLSASIRVFFNKENSVTSIKGLVEAMSRYFGHFVDYCGVIDFRKEKLGFYSIAKNSNHLSILDKDTGMIKKIVTSSNIDDEGFEKMKSSYFLLFGEQDVLKKLSNVKPEQLRNQKLVMTMEIINQLLNIKVRTALGVP